MRNANPYVILATLLLSLLLFLGWQIANDPRRLDPMKGRGGSSPARYQPGSEDRQSEKTWEERTKRWRQVLEESSGTLRVGDTPVKAEGRAPAFPDSRRAPSLPAEESSYGKDLVRDQAVRDQVRKKAEVDLEVDTLDGAVRSGESVEIVWCSPDGSVWKKIIDHPFTAQRIDEGMVRITVKAEEGQTIISAKSTGKVFAVPR
jgi:hypothetical protein